MDARVPGGDAQLLRAEALGEPGQRRFRLVTVVNGETFILWMEKQQMQALGLAIEQLVEHLPVEPGLGVSDPGFGLVDEDTRHQFRVGRIEIAFDETLEQIVVAVHDVEVDEDNDVPTLAIRISRSQGRELAEAAADLVSKGRPICPMCGMPMDPGGHVCPQQNGHLPLTFGDEYV